MSNQQNNGLTSIEAEKRLAQFGPNEIFRRTPISFFSIAKHEITEPMIVLLLIVGFFYSWWGESGDALAIFFVIISLVLAEVYNEFRAKKAIDSLEKIAAIKTKVKRDGELKRIDSLALVPGDVLILTSGTKIAADAKVQNALLLQIDESALTGESWPQDKKSGDQIFAGTVVVSGEGEAEVMATGKNTKLGKIAVAAKQVKPPRTALQLAMKSLAGKLVYLAIFFSLIILGLGIWRGHDLETMILTSLSIAFATIPEELPIIITMVLGLGSYKLSQKNFLIKKIKAAEMLGNATVIVADKTGTITQGQLAMVGVYPSNEQEIITTALAAISPYTVSQLDLQIKKRAEELNIALSNGEIVYRRNINSNSKIKFIIRKLENKLELFASGAPEEIIASCSKVDPEVINILNKETNNGRRVIAVASKKLVGQELALNNIDKLIESEKNFEFVGLLIFADSARQGVKETICRAVQAGIKTIMVTGDHPQTAEFIAKEVGILNNLDQTLTGQELDKLSDKELREVVKKVTVFSRTTPEHKYRIVQALQKNGEVVTVTGDGINDVLALKGADIGIAMGIKGTDVAKEAAEVVLADDNYITIAQGIFEGRKFFDNLQKGIKYYLSVKTALILIFLIPILFGGSLPLAPIQIIILELFMDLAASAGFVSEPAEKNIYNRPPRDPKENIFGNLVIKDILLKGFILFAVVMSAYIYAQWQNLTVSQSQAYAFASWIFGHLLLAAVSRSDQELIFQVGIFSNKIMNIWAAAALLFLFGALYLPFLNSRLHLTAPDFYQLFIIALGTIILISLLEFKKFFYGQSQT